MSCVGARAASGLLEHVAFPVLLEERSSWQHATVRPLHCAARQRVPEATATHADARRAVGAARLPIGGLVSVWRCRGHQTASHSALPLRALCAREPPLAFLTGRCLHSGQHFRVEQHRRCCQRVRRTSRRAHKVCAFIIYIHTFVFDSCILTCCTFKVHLNYIVQDSRFNTVQYYQFFLICKLFIIKTVDARSRTFRSW